jgi:hypothetical protein
MRAWNSKARFVAMIAGSQSGKTSMGAWWLAREIQDKGSGDYLVVSPTADMSRLKLLPELQKVFVEILDNGRYWGSTRVLEIRDPSNGKFWADTANDDMYARIILRSASAGDGSNDVGVRGLESATAKAAWLDECGLISEQAFEAVQRRLSLAQGRILMTTTPYSFNWLYSKVYRRWEQGDKDYFVSSFTSVENPMFPLDEYERMRKSLPDWRFQMMYCGKFTRPAGQIFGDFDPSKHVVDPVTFKYTNNVYVGIDPGAVHTGVVFLYYDFQHDRYIVFDSYVAGNMTTAEHVAKIKDKLRLFVGKQSFYGGSKSEVQCRMDMQAAGLPVMQPTVSDVEQGIGRIVTLLRADRLYVTRNNVDLIKELTEYSREVDAEGQPIDKIANKSDWHLCDSLRYACCDLDRPHRVSVASGNYRW